MNSTHRPGPALFAKSNPFLALCLATRQSVPDYRAEKTKQDPIAAVMEISATGAMGSNA